MIDPARRVEREVRPPAYSERLVEQVVRVGNILAAGVVIAGLIVGSSLIVRSGVGPTMLGYLGYGMASLLGLWLLWNMLRKP